MNPLQIGMLVLAGGIVVSMYWDKIKVLFAEGEPNTTPEKDKNITVKVTTHDHNIEDADLVDIVCCWKNLKGMCDETGLKEASAALENLFPLFVVGGEKNVQ